MTPSPVAKPLKTFLDTNMATMTFPQAMQAVIDSKRITKLEWNNPEDYGQLRNGVLMIYLNTTWHNWIISDGGMSGEDWITLE